MEENNLYQIDNKIKENKGRIIFIGLGVLFSLLALFLTKNFLYFIITCLVFISIYFIINSKNIKTKRRISSTGTIISGVISGLCLFSYLYSKWILPFTIDLLHLPNFEIIDASESLNTVANIFGIIGLVFLVFAIGYLISWYRFKKQEEKEIEKNN